MKISREAVFHTAMASAIVGFLIADHVWPAAFGPMTVSEVYDHAQDRNVIVNHDNGRAYGSGFFVGPRRIVTAAHVVSNIEDGTVMVETENGLHLDTNIVYVNNEIDTAILEVKADEDFAFYSFGSGASDSGRLYLYGHPLSRENDTLIAGTFAGYRSITFPDDPTTYHRTVVVASIAPGMSGGPVIDEYGRVSGMITARWMEIIQTPLGGLRVPTAYAAIIDLEDILRAIDECDNLSPQNAVDMAVSNG